MITESDSECESKPHKKYRNQEYEKDCKKLIKEIKTWLKISDIHKQKRLMKDELTLKTDLFKQDKEYYRNLIFFSKSETLLEDLDLEIVFCNKNPDLIDIWKYFKSMTSSANTKDSGIGFIKSMIIDKKSNKYLGIIEISYDIYNCGPRDKFIGWTKQNKEEKVKIDMDSISEEEKQKARSAFLVNITCCVGLQPMSYNLNIGKLLVTSVFSKEMTDYFRELRGYNYAGVTTFGLHGKSIQYDRLKEIKNIGETKGLGTSFFPDDLYAKIRVFLEKYDSIGLDKCRKMSSAKMRIIEYGLKYLEMDPKEVLKHGFKRGIYFGYTSDQSKDFFCGKTNTFELGSVIRPFNEIVSWWKERWAKNRLSHLMGKNIFRINFDLKDYTTKEKKNQYLRQIQFIKMKDENYLKNKREREQKYYENQKNNIDNNIDNNISHKRELTTEHKVNLSKNIAISKRNKDLTDDIIKEIFALKDSAILQKDVSEKYGINRNTVRLIWNSDILPLDDPEYEIKIKKKIDKDDCKEDNKSLSKKTSIGLRTVSINVYMEILKWRKKMINKETYENKKITYPNVTKNIQNMFQNQKITINIVKNVATGLTKMYESDFNENSEITYEDYLLIIGC